MNHDMIVIEAHRLALRSATMTIQSVKIATARDVTGAALQVIALILGK